MTPADMAAIFRGFADAIDSELAADTPPKRVAQVCADLAREYAREAISDGPAGAPRD